MYDNIHFTPNLTRFKPWPEASYQYILTIKSSCVTTSFEFFVSSSVSLGILNVTFFLDVTGFNSHNFSFFSEKYNEELSTAGQRPSFFTGLTTDGVFNFWSGDCVPEGSAWEGPLQGGPTNW